MFKKNIKFFLIIIIAALSLTGCQVLEKKPEPLKRQTFLMGTFIEITLYDRQDSDLIAKSFSRIQEIESKMTVNNASTGEIIALNQAAGVEPVEVSPDTFEVLERGLAYGQQTEGIFDITVGPLVKLWNIGTDEERKPSDNEIREKLPLVGYSGLTLDKKNLTATLSSKGMAVDLGAIAKGYAADEVKRILAEGGVKSAIISLGGNILTIGSNLNGEPWNIGIQNPFEPRGDYLGLLSVSNSSVVSSGDYERFFEEDGVRYHHIIDPFTGYPCNNELTGVTIISPLSIDGDGLSTGTFLMGLEKGMEFIENIDGVEAVFITKDKKVYTTSGLKDSFTLTDKGFKRAAID